ncbi:hypothetical protein [Pontibacillus yanchengensis]|uniref:Uncharacterized protein n=1 Tax=Pontibacillus yanchengensis Y32 TaxID=1385514 RepID=A0A0A2TTW0_9BACI|nr:hypothetical protein [Pontibacillus yanchengensis]KGP72705.1 hypothetical protein N782_11045 [Pontibacillus yanchengensis Y32]
MKKNKRTSQIDCRPTNFPNGCADIFPHKLCNNPVIQLDNPINISCEGLIAGVLKCDLQPVSGEVVKLSSSLSALTFDNPNPVTDKRGRFSTTVSVADGTPVQGGVTIQARAVVDSKEASDTIMLRAGCIQCTDPVLTLNPQEGFLRKRENALEQIITVGCGGINLAGRLDCEVEGPLAGVPVLFSVEGNTQNVLLIPNPAITDANGDYSTLLVPYFSADETVTVRTSVTVGGNTAVSDPITLQLDCRECDAPIIELDNPGPISCEATITGRVLCDEAPVPNIVVFLSSTSDILTFQPSLAKTGPDGSFSSEVIVEAGTPVQEGVDYTASATIHGTSVSNTNLVRAGCVTSCTNPRLSLDTPEAVGCEGGAVTGRLLCDDGTVPNEPVFFEIDTTSEDVFLDHNPAITKEDGTFSTNLVIGEVGVEETITITASTTVGGETVSAGPNTVEVDCPSQDCPCKFRLDTQGNPQPGANIRITRFGQQQDVTGTLNITVVQCGASPTGGCNPAVDNFNFTFNARGDTFQFTRGRRTSISCNEEGTIAKLQGEAHGRINNGPPRTFQVSITATLDAVTDVITWEIFADDLTTTTLETIVPFVAQGSPQTFITSCP